MNVAQRLDALRSAHNEIDTATYVDMGSGTVLCSSARIEAPQERLDALCATAKQCLNGPMGHADEAIVMKATEVVFCARSQTNPSEALCVVCAPGVSVADAAGWARNLVTDLRD